MYQGKKKKSIAILPLTRTGNQNESDGAEHCPFSISPIKLLSSSLCCLSRIKKAGRRRLEDPIQMNFLVLAIVSVLLTRII